MLVYGKNVAKEYLKTNKVNKVYLADNFKDQEILSLIDNKLKIEYLDKKRLSKYPKANQGIILDILDYEYKSLDLNTSFLVMLDHIEDPHNFGAIIRSCEASGVDGIIIPKDRQVMVNDTVLKTSVGTASKVNIIKVTNLTNTIKELKKAGFWIIGTDMNGQDYSTIDYKDKICIICGNEGHGLSDLVKKQCDFIASIPMSGSVNSLNASVATGIILFKALESRGK